MSLSPSDKIKLWSPNALACWSLLVTPIFSSFYLFNNAQKLNDIERQKKARNWIIAGFAIWILSTFCAINFPNNNGLVNGLSLWYLIIWYFAYIRHEAQHIKQRLGQHYVGHSKKEWFILIIIGLCFRLLLIFISIFLISLF
ncbi:hypothetical protein [Acinetobacter haemolyticus]|uniref:hypothetical protein n=1 Tax=Acinetobacter haemolyticus TaxID=29430 RepID=UPI0013B04B49|nr:hypothetical protein [Acinetobacter haemolyticus]WHR58948.1 hypothetical protein PGW89_05815 [Acinetobacter haemolyticus]